MSRQSGTRQTVKQKDMKTPLKASRQIFKQKNIQTIEAGRQTVKQRQTDSRADKQKDIQTLEA